MTWSAPPPSGGPSLEPANPTSALRSVEWGLGALAGPGAGQAEASAVFGFDRAALGALITVGGTNAHVGLGVHLAGGPRFRVSDGVRLDLLADLGLVFFGREGKASSLSSTADSSGSDAVLPAAGARAGFTFTSARTGWYLSLGAGIRHVQRSTVTYTERRCYIFGPCVDVPLSVDYGGTVAGGYLVLGQTAAPPRRP